MLPADFKQFSSWVSKLDCMCQDSSSMLFPDKGPLNVAKDLRMYSRAPSQISGWPGAFPSAASSVIVMNCGNLVVTSRGGGLPLLFSLGNPLLRLQRPAGFPRQLKFKNGTLYENLFRNVHDKPKLSYLAHRIRAA